MFIKINPGLTGVYRSIKLLLFRFCHALTHGFALSRIGASSTGFKSRFLAARRLLTIHHNNLL